MTSTNAEVTVVSRLRALLVPLAIGSTIEESDTFREFQSALELLLPAELAVSYPWWRGESLDAFRFSVARKVASTEAEFVGLCLLISQCWTPLHLRLRVSSQNDTIERLDLKLGEAGSGVGGMSTTPYGSSRETKLLYGLATRLEAIEWVYAVRRGAA